MTLEFIEKRIKEQDEYIKQQWKRYSRGEISLDRCTIIISSACDQEMYFRGEKQKLIANEK